MNLEKRLLELATSRLSSIELREAQKEADPIYIKEQELKVLKRARREEQISKLTQLALSKLPKLPRITINK